MWVMPSRGRKARAQETLNAISKLSIDCSGVVWVDGDDYGELILPDNWGHVRTDDHQELGGVLRQVFMQYPHEPFYGFISDDTVPQTRGWNTALELSAGSWGMSSSNDMWKGPARMAGALCFGGEFLRALGYWVPAGMCHLYIDDVWEVLGKALENWVYRKDVIVEHYHPARGKRQRDDTDSRTLNGKSYSGSDQRLFGQWQATKEKDIERVRKAMRVLRTAAA